MNIDVVRGSWIFFFTYFTKCLFQNCPLACSSPKQAGGYFPEFGSPGAPVLSPIYSPKLECNEIKRPTSDTNSKLKIVGNTSEQFPIGKTIVEMIFSPPKHIVCKRKLNFSDSPDATSIKPLRRRKLIKVVLCYDKSLLAIS